VNPFYFNLSSCVCCSFTFCPAFYIFRLGYLTKLLVPETYINSNNRVNKKSIIGKDAKGINHDVIMDIFGDLLG